MVFGAFPNLVCSNYWKMYMNMINEFKVDIVRRIREGRRGRRQRFCKVINKFHSSTSVEFPILSVYHFFFKKTNCNTFLANLEEFKVKGVFLGSFCPRFEKLLMT